MIIELKDWEFKLTLIIVHESKKIWINNGEYKWFGRKIANKKK